MVPTRLRIVGRRAYLSRMHKTAFEPCIPTRGTKVPAGPDWLHEIKHDGYRMIVQRDGKRDVAGHGHVLLIASCGSGFGAQNAPDAWNDYLFRASTLHAAVENLDDRRR